MFEETLNLINEIETNFPVQDLTFKGVQVWPMIRLTHTYYRRIQRSSSVKASSSKSVFGNSHTGANTVSNLIKNGLTAPRYFKQKDPKPTHSPSPVPYLFLLPYNGRNTKINGKYFATILDSTRAFLDQPSTILEFSIFHAPKVPRFSNSVIISLALCKRFIQAELTNKLSFQKGQIQGLKEYSQFLVSRNISAKTDEKYLARYCHRILAYKDYFLKLFEQYQPKVLLMQSTYSPVCMGAILACKQQGIHSVDIQHGNLGKFHLMYHRWKNIPTTGYDLLPNTYWSWSHKEASSMQDWISTTNNHQVVVGGNPWLTYAKENDTNQITSEQITQYQKITANKKHIVLVSTQLMQDFKDSCIIEAMQQAGDDYLWLIRLHPNFRKFTEETRQFLEDQGCKNFEFQLANELPLYYLFKHISVQLSFWSTVIIEALSFEVHTIIVHPHGRDSMKDYVEKGIFHYTQNSHELLQLIEANNFTPEGDNKYIETSATLVRDTLNQLLKKSTPITIQDSKATNIG